MSCYLKFKIFEKVNFEHLQNVFQHIKDAKNNGHIKNDTFLLQIFPDYALKQFIFTENDEKPDFKTADNNEFTWHFYSLIQLLQIDYGIEYLDCFITDKENGQLTYDAYEYPYGGISGLVFFIHSFGCVPTIIDDGTSVYEINFLSNGDFSITDMEDINKQNSSKKLFNSSLLLEKFARRFK